MKNNKKGFTLAELLIVVAIIAVLVAIAIPVFSGQLEKAKKAADEANLRAAYSEAVVDYLSEGKFDTTYSSGGLTCTASIENDVVTVKATAGMQSNAYKNGFSFSNGIFSATSVPVPSPTPTPEG